MVSTRTLRRDEAVSRARQVTVESYDVRLDLATDDRTFESSTTVDFRADGGETWLDLHPVQVRDLRLDGAPLDPDLLEQGRLPLVLTPGEHRIQVDAVMRFRHDGEGLHRSVDPADGREYVYGMSFMDAAPSVFACFDQPDLKAPLTLHVRAPEDWVVVGNAPGRQVEPGQWEFDPTPPLSTYFVTLVAGPYHVIRTEHDGIPLGLSARASLAPHLDKDAEELFTLTAQCFDEFHRLFGIRYPFGDYHQAFVPEFNAGAMENPGCVTFRDPLVFSSRVTRGRRITRATTVAHEMAHQWFGNLTTPLWWDDLWLNESFAEYMGVRVTADVTEFDDAWVNHAHSRRQWGLVADRRPSTHPVAGNGAEDAASALQDFDGISYSKGSALVGQLNAMLGDERFLAGVIDHFRSHWFGNATMQDLVGSWERASGSDLGDFVTQWLGRAGVDVLALDRDAGLLTRTVAGVAPADRRHRVRVATAEKPGAWSVTPLEVAGDPVPVSVAAGAAVLLDPFQDSWVVPHLDERSARELVRLLPGTTEPMLRAGAWNALHSTFHDGALDPGRFMDVVAAALPSEDADDAFFYDMRDVTARVVALSDDPLAALTTVHEAARQRLETAPPGSSLQLAALLTAVDSSPGGAVLADWGEGRALPDGVELDLELRWRILVRRAVLGEVDRDELEQALDAERTAVSHVAHVKALASLPDADAKAAAWRYFTGENDAPNYDVEAAGLGLWRPGQEALTQQYVERYFDELPGTVDVRAGWTLAEAATWFFPLTSLEPSTLSRAHDLIADPDLEPSLRRALVDSADELGRRLAVRERFGRR